jgi:predicted ATPase
MLGYPDQPVQKIDEALRLAQELGSPFVLAEALGDAALFHLLRKDGQRAQVRAEQCLALSTEYEFVSYLALATEQRGEALARQGRVEEGVALMREGLAAYQATGAKIARSHYLTRLAEAYGEVGRAEEGLSLLIEALTHVDKTGERFYEAELYRVKGELMLQSRVQGPQSIVEEKAEGCFLKAIEIARQQPAKSWELRATTSLARLWQRQGRKDEPRQMLAEIYGWFTEGFDTADLKEAKALLEELSH